MLSCMTRPPSLQLFLQKRLMFKGQWKIGEVACSFPPVANLARLVHSEPSREAARNLAVERALPRFPSRPKYRAAHKLFQRVESQNSDFR